MGDVAGSEPIGARPRLLCVEDDRDIAQMLAEVLSEDYEVESALTGEEGLELALRARFDVMLVDRMLPGIDGLSMIRRVRRAGIRTPVLILTALGTVRDKVAGLDGGANDYLVKPFDVDELLARLRALRRGFEAQSERRAVGAWTYTPADRTLHSPYGSRVLLTQRENALLRLLSESPEHVFSREEILRAVFSPRDTPGTVDTYVHYLRRKIGRDAVETVRSRGYRLGDPQ